MGAKKIYARLTEFGKKYGGLYEPCAYLTNCAHQGKTIAEGPNRARL
jgi:enoyl-CoA hydratase/3-hydroxyacyl-CoA dehydrogenase